MEEKKKEQLEYSKLNRKRTGILLEKEKLNKELEREKINLQKSKQDFVLQKEKERNKIRDSLVREFHNKLENEISNKEKDIRTQLRNEFELKLK